MENNAKKEHMCVYNSRVTAVQQKLDNIANQPYFQFKKEREGVPTVVQRK